MPDEENWKDVEHRCSALPEPGVSIVRSEHVSNLEEWSWCLRIERTATESDLEENHYLDQVGDTIWSTRVGVSHCPYCGAELEAKPNRKSPLVSEFEHLDCRGWSVELL